MGKEVEGPGLGEDAESILVATAAKLSERKNGDLELAGLLIKHVLTTKPAKSAVEDALTAIQGLAVARAKAAMAKKDVTVDE